MSAEGKAVGKAGEHIIAETVEKAGVRDAEGVAAREAEHTAAKTADAETERAVADTATRARELQNSMPEGSRGRVTMASGVGRKGNKLVRVVGTSEPNGYLRKGVKLREGEELATGDGHAETSILDHMKKNKITPIAVGAGRPVCPPCATRLNDVAARITTPLKSVKVRR